MKRIKWHEPFIVIFGGSITLLTGVIAIILMQHKPLIYYTNSAGEAVHAGFSVSRPYEYFYGIDEMGFAFFSALSSGFFISWMIAKNRANKVPTHRCPPPASYL